MSNNLQIGIRVASEGAVRSINDLGDVAKKAGKEIAEGLSKGFDSASKSIDNFGKGIGSSKIGEFGQSIKDNFGSMEGFGKMAGNIAVTGVQALGVALAGATVAGIAFGNQMVEMATKLQNVSLATDVTTDTLSRLSTMVVKGGGSLEDTGDIAKDFADKLGDARRNGGEMAETFKKLGVDLNGSTDKALQQTITSLGKIEDKSQSVNIGMSIFSDAYITLASQIAQGNTIMGQSPIFSDEFISKSGQLSDAFNKLKVELITLGTEAILPLVEGTSELVSWLTTPSLSGETPIASAMKEFAKWAENASTNGRILLGVLSGKTKMKTEEMPTAGEALPMNVANLKMSEDQLASLQAKYDQYYETKLNYERSYSAETLKNEEEYQEALRQTNVNITESYANRLMYMRKDVDAQRKIVNSNKTDVDNQAKEEARQAKLKQDAIQAEIDAGRRASELAIARAKAESEAKMAEAKRLAEYQSALSKALGIAESVRADNLSQTLEGRKQLIREEEAEQIKAINAVKQSDIDKTSALEDIKIRSARKIADEEKKYNDEVARDKDDANKKIAERDRARLEYYTKLSTDITKIVGSKGAQASPEAVDVALRFKLGLDRDALDKSIDEVSKAFSNYINEERNGFAMGDDPEAEKKYWDEREKAGLEAIGKYRDSMYGETAQAMTDIQDNIAKYGSAEAPETLIGRMFKITGEDEENAQNALDFAGQTLQAGMDMWQTFMDMKAEKDQKAVDDYTKRRYQELGAMVITNRARAKEEKKIQAEVEQMKKDAFQKQKAYQIASIQVSTGAAIASAWASAMQIQPLPLGIALGALQTAFLVGNAIAQTANVSKQSYATGGIIGGANGVSMGADNTVANVRTGEMVLNGSQQAHMWNILNGKKSANSEGINITIEGNVTQDSLIELEDMLNQLRSNGRL